MALKSGTEEKSESNGQNPGQVRSRHTPLGEDGTQTFGQCQDNRYKGESSFHSMSSCGPLTGVHSACLGVDCSTVDVYAFVCVLQKLFVQISGW